ncbi:MAG: zinc-ribbon domain-containing protein [Candidatus Saccharimonadaceae bacterium]|nr:zinc-ribbon domain-containing protein [Candidatus Saccharimonadaceae bacterium]
MKQCEKCGQEIPEGVAFCPNCGAAVNAEQPSASPAMASMPTNTFQGSQAINAENASAMPVAPAAPIAAQPINPVTPLQAMPDNGAKKKVDGKIIAMAVACIICLTVGIVGIVMAVSSNKNSEPVATTGSNTPDPSGEVEVPATGSTGAKVSYAGYEFSIPTSYNYEIYTQDGMECLSVSDSPTEYLADICYYNDHTFTAVENNIDLITESINTQYGTSATTGTEIIDGKKYYYFDLGAMQGQNAMIVLSGIDLYYFTTYVSTRVGVSGTEYLDKIAKVINTAQKKKDMVRSTNDDGGLESIKIMQFNNIPDNS